MVIVFLIYPFTGPLNSTLKLAKLLKHRGHTITYIAPQKYKDRIQSYGFEFSTMESLAGEKGPLDNIGTLERYAQYLSFPKDHQSPIFKAFEAIKDKFLPDLLVLDSDIIGFAMVAYYYDLKVILLNELIQSDKTPRIPPYDSPLIPDQTFWSFICVEIAWAKRLLKKKTFYFLDKVIRKKDDPHHLKLAYLCNFPLKENANYKRVWYYSLKNFPELSLYPLEFDFPRKHIPDNQFYVGPMIDTERENDDVFDCTPFLNGRPIVYCSFGTLPEVYLEKFRDFFTSLILIFEKWPEINLVLAVGNNAYNGQTHSDASNIFIYEFVPQLRILQLASLMVTHAGINSIKECIYYGVPVLAYPLIKDSEQQGNAARVIFHGLGCQGNLNSDHQQKIEDDIKEVFSNDLYRKNALKMKKIFHQYLQREEKVLQYIENYVSSVNGNG
jgi:zeaxanthin glucosyltransferase